LIMQPEALTCHICYVPYDQQDHLPRVLPDCIHTLCSCCLDGILKSDKEIRCPFDNQALNFQSRNINDYKVNFALKDLIEEIAVQRFCETHQTEVASLYCISDQAYICNLCAYYEHHKSHEIIPLKVLEDETLNKRKQLELVMKSLDDKKKISKAFEIKKSDLVAQTQKQFKDLRLFLGMKELQVLHEIESFFSSQETILEENLGINSLLRKNIHLKFTTKPTLVSIDKDDDFSSILSKFSPENLSKFNKTTADSLSHASRCLNLSLLMNAQTDLLNLQFPTHEFRQQTQNIYAKTFQDFETLTSEKTDPIFETVSNIEEEKKENFEINKAYVDKLRGNSLDLDERGFCDSTNEAIIEALKQIPDIKTLKLDLVVTKITDSELISLGLLLSQTPSTLKNLEVALTNCDLTDQSISYLFDKILAQPQHLRFLDIDLRNTRISTKGLKALTNFISKNSNTLEFFHIDLSKTELSDKLIAQIFPSMNSLKGFRINLNSTKAAEQSVETIAKSFSPNLLNLEYFELCLYETKVKDENVVKFFQKMDNIKRFVLVLSHTKVTDTTLETFVLNTLFKANVLEELELHFASTSITDQSVTKLFNCIINLKNFVLNLESTKVSDKSIKPFVTNTLSSVNYKGEFEMYLRNTKVTDKTQKLVMKQSNILRKIANP